jgi:hypothetical protein
MVRPLSVHQDRDFEIEYKPPATILLQEVPSRSFRQEVQGVVDT